MSDQPELLPCPFCGGDAGPITDATRILGTWNFVHRCPVIGPFKIERSTRNSVVETWNRRAAPDRALIASDAARKLAEERLEKIAPLLDRAVNGPWLNGDLERARAILKEIDNG